MRPESLRPESLQPESLQPMTATCAARRTPSVQLVPPASSLWVYKLTSFFHVHEHDHYMRVARPRLLAASATNVARWCLSLVLFPRCQPDSASPGSMHGGARWPRASRRFTSFPPGAAAHTERGTRAAGSGGQFPGAARLGGSSQLEGYAARRCLSYVGPSTAQVEEEIELDVSEARKLASKMRRQRQLEMSFPAAKREGSHQHPVVMRVYIDQELRTLLKLAGRERRGRVVVEADDPSLAALTAALEARFPIGAVPYRLQARWQRRVRRVAPDDDDEGRQREALSVSDDNSVARLFELASGASSDGIRVELHVLMSSKARVKDERPNPEIISLLTASSEWCMVSFYSFVGIEQPVAVAEELQTRWSKMGILGRTYVAEEGINAQLAVSCVCVCMLVRVCVCVRACERVRVCA